MKRADGFTLLEVLLYLSSASVLMLSSLTFMTDLYHQVHQLEKVHMWYQALTVLDVMRHDLAAACGDGATWDAAQCLFTCQTLDDDGILQSSAVRWSQAQGAWKRRSGHYAFATQRWTGTVVRQFFTTLTGLSYHLTYDAQVPSRVVGVTLSYNLCLPGKAAPQRYAEYITLHNRVIS